MFNLFKKKETTALADHARMILNTPYYQTRLTTDGREAASYLRRVAQDISEKGKVVNFVCSFGDKGYDIITIAIKLEERCASE